MILDRFQIEPSESTLLKEVLGGITTFLAIPDVVFVNSTILTSDTGMPYSGVLAATVLTAALNLILMGFWANLSYAVAPGMGLNAFVAFTIIGTMGVHWQTALGMVVVSGVFFGVVSATSFCHSPGAGSRGADFASQCGTFSRQGLADIGSRIHDHGANTPDLFHQQGDYGRSRDSRSVKCSLWTTFADSVRVERYGEWGGSLQVIANAS